VDHPKKKRIKEAMARRTRDVISKASLTAPRRYEVHRRVMMMKLRNTQKISFFLLSPVPHQNEAMKVKVDMVWVFLTNVKLWLKSLLFLFLFLFFVRLSLSSS